MPDSELIPNLQLIPLHRLRFHEHTERRRTLRVMERIRTECVLRNPPIVADLPDGNFLLLDGANRATAFQELGYSHLPAQVVDYGSGHIQLKGWHHLLIDGRRLRLREVYAALPGVDLRPVERERLSRLLELRQVFAVLAEGEDACWGLFPDKPEPRIEVHERIRVAEQVVAAYEGQSGIERIKLAEFHRLPEVIRSADHHLCLFPVITKDEMLELAAEQVMIPTGLTRHLIPGRALGINLPLGFLRDLPDEAAKQRHFAAFIDRLEVEGRIRFYEEPVFIMNE